MYLLYHVQHKNLHTTTKHNQRGFNCLTTYSSHSTRNATRKEQQQCPTATVFLSSMTIDSEHGTCITPCYPSTSGSQPSYHWQQRGHVAVLAHSGKAPLWRDPTPRSQRRLGLETMRSSPGTSLLLLGKLPHTQYAQYFVLKRNMIMNIMSVFSTIICLPVCLRYLRLISSTGKKPTVAPYSGHMLEMVALSAMDSCVIPGP